MKEQFDLVVIGAGPAGSFAAREAAVRGVGSVLLLEKDGWPRDKVCAGGLGPRARRMLRSAGLWEKVAGVGYPIRAARLLTPGGRDLLLSGSRTDLVAPRLRFDALLAEEAVRAGAALRTGCPVRHLVEEQGRLHAVLADGSRIGARRVIVANGAGSRFHRLPAPRMRWLACLCRYEGVSFRPHTIEFHFDAALFPRYGWLFPESARTVNVGFCVDRRMLRGYSPRELFEDFLQRCLGERLRGARPAGRPRWQAMLPSSRVIHCALPNTLLAGDALRLVNPFTGEGIGYALVSGQLAARVAAEGLQHGWDDGHAASCYARALRRSLEPSLRVGDWVSRRGRLLLRLAARAASTRLGKRLIYNALA